MLFHHVAGYVQTFGDFGVAQILKFAQYKYYPAFGRQLVDSLDQLIQTLTGCNNLFRKFNNNYC